MLRNVIYRYEWKGIKTGWDYRIEFTPPDTLDLDNPTLINLPKGCININKISSKFEKYPIGMPTAPALELDFNLNRIDSADFKELLFNPIKEKVIPFLFVQQCPILVNMYIKYNGNDTNVPVPYRLFFTGGIRESIFESEGPKSIVKATALDINKIIYDSMDFIFTSTYYNAEDNIVTTAYYDMAYKVGSSSRAFCHGYPAVLRNPKLDYKFHSVKWDTHIDSLQIMGQILYRNILRKSDAVYNFEVNLPKMYKQRLDGSGAKGAELTSSEIYFIGFIEKKGGSEYVVLDGVAGDGETSLQAKYPNSVWDYLTELPENLLLKTYLTPDGMYLNHVYGVMAGAKQVLNLNLKRVLNYKLMIRQNILKTATASMHEARTSELISDMKKYDATDKGSRNSDEFAAPIYHNNMPTAIEYTLVEAGGPNNLWFYSANPRTTTFVYLENISTIISFENNRPLRIHQFVDFPLGNGALSSSLPNCSENIINYSNYMDKKDRHTLPMYIQDRSLPVLLANAILALFNGSEQAILELETRFDLHTEFLPGGSIGFPWWRFDAEFTIPSEDISAHYATTLNTYDMLESELDFNTETAKVKLLLRTV